MSSKKWNTSYDSNRKYNSKWKKTFLWLKKANNGIESTYCKLCLCAISSRYSNLQNYQKSDKYQKRVPVKGQMQLNSLIVENLNNKISERLKPQN